VHAKVKACRKLSCIIRAGARRTYAYKPQRSRLFPKVFVLSELGGLQRRLGILMLYGTSSGCGEIVGIPTAKTDRPDTVTMLVNGVTAICVRRTMLDALFFRIRKFRQLRECFAIDSRQNLPH